MSHAHLDHSGDAPALYKQGFPVSFGTPPTLQLAELLIEDSIKINRKNKVTPPFVKRDLKSFMGRYMAHAYGSVIDFGEYEISLHDAGHISGSAMTLIKSRKSGKRILYTGDFKLSPQILKSGAEIVETDVLITETTYATSLHPDRAVLSKKFIEDVKSVIVHGGIALVPVFAVGRAQELLALLYQNGLADVTYIDGMAKKATDITMQHPQYIENDALLVKAMQRVNWVDTMDVRSKAIGGGNIILTTAGMLNGGPVLNYIQRLNPASKIFLTGYQVEGTNGNRLMEGKPLIIDGRKFHVKVPWTFYDFSAHSDKNDLEEFVRKSHPETIICVHGDHDNASTFAENMKLEGYDAVAPKVGDRVAVDF